MSDSDSDADFFTVKKPIVVRNLAPTPQIVPDVVSISGSSDSEGEGSSPRKKKRRKTKAAPKRMLPEWTRGESKSQERKSRSVGRGSTEQRDIRERASLDRMSETDGYASQGKGKGKEVAKRKFRALTPPPELSEEKKAELHRQVDEIFKEKDILPIDVDAADHPQTSSPPPEPATRDHIMINVKMQADDLKHPPGESSNAARLVFEKNRSLRIYRDEALKLAWEAVADRIHKKTEDLVFTYKGQKLFSAHTTPRNLRMEDGAEILGYEKDYWERLEREKKEKRQKLLRPPEDTPEKQYPIEDDRPKAISVSLRGAWGEWRIRVQPGVTVKELKDAYCSKAGKPARSAGKIKVMFDGDSQDAETTVAELDCEDGDIIDMAV